MNRVLEFIHQGARTWPLTDGQTEEIEELPENPTVYQIAGRYAGLTAAAAEGRIPPVPRPGLAARMIAGARKKAWDPPLGAYPDFGIDLPHRGVKCVDAALGVLNAVNRLQQSLDEEQGGQRVNAARLREDARLDLDALEKWAISKDVDVRWTPE